jgi:choline dehydrogenase
MEYDDIIVGAGSSGAVLTARLSEDPNRSVLLLEAGPDYRTIDETPNDLLRSSISFADHDWGWAAQATPQREIHLWRGEVTGGCSAINASVAIRGVPADFDEWAALGNDQWSFEKVLPFHRKLEHDADFGGDSHGKGGPIWIERPKPSKWHPTVSAFYASCRAMGFADSPDFNDPQSTGVGPCARNLRDGIRVSTAIGYLALARDRLNLTIRGGCLANRVVIENGRAVGVEVEAGGEKHRVYGKRVTLSAGAFASPTILMRSGIGQRAELERHGIRTLLDAPGVGANLIDHPLVLMLAELSSEAIQHSEDTDHSRWSVLLRYTATGSDEFNDMQLHFVPMVDWTMVPGFSGRTRNRTNVAGVSGASASAFARQAQPAQRKSSRSAEYRPQLFRRSRGHAPHDGRHALGMANHASAGGRERMEGADGGSIGAGSRPVYSGLEYRDH